MKWHQDEETGTWTCTNADASVRGTVTGTDLDFASPKPGGGWNYARWSAVVGASPPVYAPSEAEAKALVEAEPFTSQAPEKKT